VGQLASNGFELQGGRVDIVQGRTVAGLVYRSRDQVFDVFIWRTANQMTPRMLAHARAINGSTGEKTDWSFVRFQAPLHLTCKRCSGSWR
jgi:anti-sigma factor RsiW